MHSYLLPHPLYSLYDVNVSVAAPGIAGLSALVTASGTWISLSALTSWVVAALYICSCSVACWSRQKNESLSPSSRSPYSPRHAHSIVDWMENMEHMNKGLSSHHFLLLSTDFPLCLGFCSLPQPKHMLCQWAALQPCPCLILLAPHNLTASHKPTLHSFLPLSTLLPTPRAW